MKLDGTSVVVTGANGFIGSWLCRKLVEQGAEVTALVHSGSELLKLQGVEEKVKLEKASITDFDALKKIFDESETHLCFHLAALASTKLASRDLFETFQTNVIGTLNVLETAKQSNAGVCFASTVKVYGGMTEKGFDENDASLGKSAYATSKICGEAVCRMYAKNFGLNVSIARPGNVFGWSDLKFERLVPGAIKAILQEKDPKVNGTGGNEFDFVFVDDAVECLVLLGKKMLDKKFEGEAFNIGSGTATSVKELVGKIIKLHGGSSKIDFVGEEAHCREKLLIERAAEELDWKPKYDLDSALKETIKWYKTNAGVLR